MACCGGKSTVGNEDNPVLVGEPNGAPAVRYKSYSTIGGVGFGQTAYFTGSDVADLVAVGYLEAV